MKLFYYRFKALVGDKALLFWSFAFPMLLAVFFNFTLVDVHKGNTLDVIPVAITEVSENTLNMVETLEDANLIEVISTDTSLIEMLDSGEIEAIISDKDGKINLEVKNSNLNVSILSMAVEEYNRQVSYIEEVAAKSPANIQPFVDSLLTDDNFIEKDNQEVFSPVVIYFYTTLAMLCLYAGNWGQKSSEFLNPLQSGMGIRNSIAPTSKAKVIFQELGAVYFIFLLEFIIHTLFLKYILGVPLGEEPLLYIMTGLIGGMLSITIGYVSGVSFKDKNKGQMFITYFGLASSFLSGMMAIDIRNLVNDYIPWIKIFSPGSLITDNLYYIVLQEDTMKIWINILFMLGASILLWIFAYRKLKVVSYDSI